MITTGPCLHPYPYKPGVSHRATARVLQVLQVVGKGTKIVPCCSRRLLSARRWIGERTIGSILLKTRAQGWPITPHHRLRRHVSTRCENSIDVKLFCSPSKRTPLPG